MLLVTDRRDQGPKLQAVVSAVEPCGLVILGQPLGAPSDHAIIVCDVALDTAESVMRTRAALAHHRVAPTVPVLHLTRDANQIANSQTIGATAVLPHDTSDAQILFTIRRLIEKVRAPRRKPQVVDRVVAANVREAGAALSDLFTASRRGEPITVTSLERGGNAVIAAVGGGRIGVWLDVVRSYDDITYQHCLIVAGLTAAFSAHLGMTLKGQRLVSEAALVHDIGKAIVPHAILNKPGPLSPAEMTVMRTHSAAGYDMLISQGGFDPQIVDIVRHHHEYLDGSGYPDGLRADAISPLVRLVTICDIYAALIERRPYKAPSTPERALSILVDMGPKLDAGLVKAFHGVIERS